METNRQPAEPNQHLQYQQGSFRLQLHLALRCLEPKRERAEAQKQRKERNMWIWHCVTKEEASTHNVADDLGHFARHVSILVCTRRKRSRALVEAAAARDSFFGSGLNASNRRHHSLLHHKLLVVANISVEEPLHIAFGAHFVLDVGWGARTKKQRLVAFTQKHSCKPAGNTDRGNQSETRTN